MEQTNRYENRGIVYRIRTLKGFSFLHIDCDGRLIQSVLSGELPEGLKEQSAVTFAGEWVPAVIKDTLVEPKTSELKLSHIEVLSTPPEPMPFDITKGELNIHNDVLFDLRPVSLRHPKIKAVFKIQEGIVRAFREFFYQEGFTEIRTPKIVKGGAEGGGNIFSLNYFGETAYLAQSPQFYKEMMVQVYQRVFEIGPVFRAEKHNTSRHINEYTSMDIEFGPIKSFVEIMEMEEKFLIYLFGFLQSHYKRELEILQVKVPAIKKIPRISFTEVKNLMKREFGIVEEDDDLSPQEEQKLAEYVEKTFQSEFVFVTHYATSKRPFYVKETAGDETVTESFDLIYRGTEITTGGQRIHELSVLEEKIRNRGMNPADFEFFTNTHKYGLIPHGGFGMGLERLTQKLTGLQNIKEATLFPRDVSRLIP